MLRAFIIVILLLLAARAAAHEWYPLDCCSGHDCGPLEDDRVSRTPEGDYLLDGKWLFTRAEVKPSLSGRFHGCFPQEGVRPKCFFVPPDGS